MDKMPIISLPETAKALGDSGKRVNVLWQQPDSLVFMARGREYRSEFHINPSDEVMYPVKGDLRLHYRNEEGKEEIAEVPEGSVIYTPAGTPHSPRFAPDAYLLVVDTPYFAKHRSAAPTTRSRASPAEPSTLSTASVPATAISAA